MIPEGESNEPLIPMWLGWAEETRKAFAGSHIGVQQAISTFVQTMEETAKVIRHGFEARLNQYPDLVSKLPTYAKHGWFISLYFGLSELDQLATQSHSISDNQIDSVLAQMYRDSIREHTKDIISDNPERAFAIRPAIEAHNQGEFALSVPIFFAQSDGILAAKAGRQLFRKVRGIEQIFDQAQEKLTSIPSGDIGLSAAWEALMIGMSWGSLQEKPPICYTENERKQKGYTGLNRHTVLHGEALVEYATEINSLKAFSLLSFISALTTTEP